MKDYDQVISVVCLMFSKISVFFSLQNKLNQLSYLLNIYLLSLHNKWNRVICIVKSFMKLFSKVKVILLKVNADN